MPLDDNPFAYGFPKAGNRIFYFYNYIDTIFEISTGYPIPAIILDYGKYKNSKENFSVSEKNNKVLSRPRILEFSVGDNYLKPTIYYPFNSERYSILYRVRDGKQIAWTKLINDIDNGTIDRWDGFLFNDCLIFHLLPSTIIERFEKMTETEKIDPKNSGFVTMALKITPESNPVIMICNLK